MANKREKRKSSNASTAPVSLEFTEEMKGYITLSPKSSYQDSYSAGKKEKIILCFT